MNVNTVIGRRPDLTSCLGFQLPEFTSKYEGNLVLYYDLKYRSVVLAKAGIGVRCKI
jgi:hypothetical protein